MDNLIEFLITIALVALFTIPSWLKKKDGTLATSPLPEPEYEEEMDDETSPFLQNSTEEVPKQQEYFTYETLTDDEETMWNSEMEQPETQVQQLENKEKGEGLLTFEENEVLKGVIYSEIIKKISKYLI